MSACRTACLAAGLLAFTAPVGVSARPVPKARATGTATIADRPVAVVVEVVRDVELKLLVSLGAPLVASIDVQRPGSSGETGPIGARLTSAGFVAGDDLVAGPDVAVSIAEPDADDGAADGGQMIVLVQYN